MLGLVLNAGGLVCLLLGPLVWNVMGKVFTSLLRNLMLVVDGSLEVHPLMDKVFKFLLILKLFLFRVLNLGRKPLFMRVKVIKFHFLSLHFRVSQLARCMMEWDRHT
jgi:hypothetical protein